MRIYSRLEVLLSNRTVVINRHKTINNYNLVTAAFILEFKKNEIMNDYKYK